METTSQNQRSLNRWSGTRDATFENLQIGAEMGPMHVEVTESRVKSYAFCMDDYRPWHFDDSPFGGPVAHADLLANDLLNIKYTTYDRMTVAGLHTEQELTFLRPVPVGETVTVTGRYTEKYTRRDNGNAIMEAEARDNAGNVLIRHRNAEITRVEPGLVVGRASADPSGPRIVPEISTLEPADRPVAGMAPGTPLPALVKTLTQAQMSVYSFVGEHERNFHNDREFAKEHGLDDTIAQGLQVAGYYSNLCTEFFDADWFTSGWLKAKFIKPIFPQSVLHIQGKVSGQQPEAGGRTRTNVEMWVKDQDDRLLSVAWASALNNL